MTSFFLLPFNVTQLFGRICDMLESVAISLFVKLHINYLK